MPHTQFSLAAIQRFKYWSPSSEEPTKVLRMLFHESKLVEAKKVKSLLGVTYNPKWAYYMSPEWLFATTPSRDPRYTLYVPCIFPIPLPKHQISKGVLQRYRKDVSRFSSYASIVRDFEKGRPLTRGQAGELLGSPTTFQGEDVLFVYVEGKGLLYAEGPNRRQRDKRDFSAHHYFAPIQIRKFQPLDIDLKDLKLTPSKWEI